jgi:hypothetical protein
MGEVKTTTSAYVRAQAAVSVVAVSRAYSQDHEHPQAAVSVVAVTRAYAQDHDHR